MSLVPRNNKEKNLEGAKRSETQKEREENVQCLKCGTCKIKNMFYKKITQEQTLILKFSSMIFQEVCLSFSLNRTRQSKSQNNPPKNPCSALQLMWD